MQNITYFTIPDEKTRKEAIGSLAGTPIRIKKALNVIIPFFSPLPKPGPSDWLADHDEDGQTFECYVSQPKNYVDQKRKVIYIQPLEENIDKDFVKSLSDFTKAYYYGMEVKVRPYLSVEKLNAETRVNEYSGKAQYNAAHILRGLEGKLPSDAYCMIAICMTDLYPKDEWNFVFGLASIKNRTGVFSFARYQESFYFDEETEEILPDKSRLLFRSCKVMVHEIGHMFGIRHCVHFDCIMNGSNNLEENDRKTLYLCPVCVRKLQHNIEFEMVDRYEALMKVCQELGGKFEPAARWYENVHKLILEAYGPHYKSNKDVIKPKRAAKK